MRLITLAMAATAMAGSAYAQGTNQQATVPASDAANTTTASAKTDRTGFYIGGGPTVVVFEDRDESDNVMAIGAIQGKVGYSFNDYFAIEGEATVGVAAADYDYWYGVAELNLKNEVGVFAVLSAPLGRVVGLYARVGYASAEAELDFGGGYTVSEDDSGAAYGVGIDWNVGKMILRLDYTFYDLEPKASSLGFNVLAKF